MTSHVMPLERVPGKDPAPRAPPSRVPRGAPLGTPSLPFSLPVRSAFSTTFFSSQKASFQGCLVKLVTAHYLCRMNLTPVFFFATLLFMYTYKIEKDAYPTQHTHHREGHPHSPAETGW